MIRVLLVDRDSARAGLRRALPARDGFDVVGECADGDEVAAAVEAFHPDVVLMGLRMPRMNGAEATSELNKLDHAPPVLIVTNPGDDATIVATLAAGAAGLLLRNAPSEDVARATREVASGGSWLDPAIAQAVLAAYRRTDSQP